MAGGAAVILLDTHAFARLASDPARLSKTAYEAIGKFQTGQLLSAVSGWEIALLHKRGRLLLPVAPEVFLQRAVARHGIHELPVTRQRALEAVSLPDIHNDPFERTLVAEALGRKCQIITKASVIPTYPGVSAVW